MTSHRPPQWRETKRLSNLQQPTEEFSNLRQYTPSYNLQNLRKDILTLPDLLVSYDFALETYCYRIADAGNFEMRGNISVNPATMPSKEAIF